MIIDITFKIDTEEGILNAYHLCHVLQRHFEVVLKDKARLIGYKTKINEFADYYPDDDKGEWEWNISLKLLRMVMLMIVMTG